MMRPMRPSWIARLTAVLLVLLAAMLLAACGGGDDDSGGGDDDTTTTETTEDDDGGSGDDSGSDAGDDGSSDEGDDGGISGASVFQNNCQSCHGALGAGGHVGPNLQTSSITDDAAQIEDIVRTGRGQMPSFEGTLDDAEIDAVVGYVSEDLAPRS